MSFDLNATKDNNGDGMFHLPSTSLDEDGGGGGDGGKRILMAAVLVLFLTTILVFLVHIYAEWCWTRFVNHRRQLFERSQEEQLPSSSLPPRKLDSGLDKAVIESLPMFVYSNNNNRVRLGGRGVGDEEEDEALECAVCLCEFEANEKGRLLPRCKHRFHIDCIDMWFHSHSTCPLCRASISECSNLNPNLNPDANANSNPNPNANPSGNPNADVGLETIETREIALSLPEGGGSGNPLSRSPQQNLGVQYPTNVLFWGDHYHVSSHISSPTHPNHGQSGLNIAIDIPSNIELISRPLPSHDHSTSARYPLTDNQTYTTSGHPAIKSLKTFKRFLSRDRRINPSSSSSSSSSSSLSSSFNQDERCRESNQGIAISSNS